MALLDQINERLRDFVGWSSSYPLPIGDPRTGVHNPSKADIREILLLIAQANGDPAALQTIITSLATKADAADLSALRPRESQINATAEAPLLIRVFPSTPSSPSQYMRIWMPSGQGTYAELLLKRGSLSTVPQDAGISQVTWEPDEVRAKSDAVIFRIASTNLGGAWVTDNDILPGIYARQSFDANAAREFDFTGDFFRFGYVEAVNSSAFQLEVDGKVVVQVPKGTEKGRRVITRGGFGNGPHKLVVRRAAGAT
ncbi:MAG: hypothetical protein FJX25_19660, partial [Alphaproteobacteria bacterium]|nr:hypothetical protein [Alphaproteobacteria bacterium]